MCIKRNPRFINIEEYLVEKGISPEYSLGWVQEIKDKNGNLLHYNTEIGPFVDSETNPIAQEIRNKLQNGELEMRNPEKGLHIQFIEVSIFLPRSFKFNTVGPSPLNKYSLDGEKVG